MRVITDINQWFVDDSPNLSWFHHRGQLKSQPNNDPGDGSAFWSNLFRNLFKKALNTQYIWIIITTNHPSSKIWICIDWMMSHWQWWLLDIIRCKIIDYEGLLTIACTFPVTNIAMGHHICFMGKLTISPGPFSMPQTVSHHWRVSIINCEQSFIIDHCQPLYIYIYCISCILLP